MTAIPPHLASLHNALMAVDSAPVECDGHTLMISLALTKAGIPHERIIGSVSGQNGSFALTPHLWIDIDGFILDYRLRMWVQAWSGSDDLVADAPHGIFLPSGSDEGYQYTAESSCPAPELNAAILDFMTDGYAGKLLIPDATIAHYLERKSFISR